MIHSLKGYIDIGLLRFLEVDHVLNISCENIYGKTNYMFYSLFLNNVKNESFGNSNHKSSSDSCSY